MTLTAFLLARIADDERVAKYLPGLGEKYKSASVVVDNEGTMLPLLTEERVLAECAAKRRIVESLAGRPPYRDDDHIADWAEDILRTLAIPYAEHSDFDHTWHLDGGSDG